MRKIPTLFKREFKDHNIVSISPEITEGCEDAFLNGIPTVKYDGACCAVISSELYKRFDLKPGRKLPENAIPCQDAADPVTGHFPHWVKCSKDNPSDKWFFEAVSNTSKIFYLEDGTYEACGPHFNSNPQGFMYDKLIPHGHKYAPVSNRTFDAVRDFLEENEIEGIVFWLHEEPVCKIKRSDFGFQWPPARKKTDDEGE